MEHVGGTSRHLAIIATLLAGASAALGGTAAAASLPASHGMTGVVAASGLGVLAGGLGVALASLLVRRRFRHLRLTAVTYASVVLLIVLAVSATLPTSPRHVDVVDAWDRAFAGVALASSTLAAGTAALGTEPDPAAPRRGLPVRRWWTKDSGGEPTPMPEPPLDGAAVVRRAYSLLQSPPYDTEQLVRELGPLLDDLERLTSQDGPHRSEAARVLVLVRTNMGRTLLRQSRRLVEASEQAARAQRGNPSHVASRAEEVARAALPLLEDAVSRRQAEVVVRAAQLFRLDPSTRQDRIEAEVRELHDAMEQARGPEAGADTSALREQRRSQRARLADQIELCGLLGRSDLAQDLHGLEVQLGGSDRDLPGTSRTRNQSAVLRDMVRRIPGIEQVHGELSQGGFGLTFLAEDNLGRRVVVKTLKDEFLGSRSLREAFEREARAEGRLSRSVPTVFTYHTVANRRFKVMEYIPGGSLLDKMRSWNDGNERPDPVAVVRLMREVAEVMVHAQEELGGDRFVHRDLKPSNILIDDRGHAKVTDFGLAVLPGERMLGKSGAPVGTLFYMSPEQARGDPEVTSRSDVYSMGVMLHELFTGRYPYDVHAATSPSTVRHHVSTMRTLIHEELMPVPLRALVRACLDAEPGRRPGMTDLVAELGRLERQLVDDQIIGSVWATGAPSSLVRDSLSVQEDEWIPSPHPEVNPA